MPARYDTVGRQALAGAIAELRDKRRLNQRWVAAALGVTQGAVSEWIRGISRPTVGNALCLYKLFGIPLDAWLTDEERRAVVRAETEAYRLQRSPLPERQGASRGRKPSVEDAPLKNQIPLFESVEGTA